MKKISRITYEAYEFKDLDETAKEKVISEHINFWIDIKEMNKENPGNFERAVKDAERNRTPWFLGSYIYDYCKEEIIDEIKASNYLFDKSGNILPIRYICDKDGTIIKSLLQLSSAAEIEINIENI